MPCGSKARDRNISATGNERANERWPAAEVACSLASLLASSLPLLHHPHHHHPPVAPSHKATTSCSPASSRQRRPWHSSLSSPTYLFSSSSPSSSPSSVPPPSSPPKKSWASPARTRRARTASSPSPVLPSVPLVACRLLLRRGLVMKWVGKFVGDLEGISARIVMRLGVRGIVIIMGLTTIGVPLERRERG